MADLVRAGHLAELGRFHEAEVLIRSHLSEDPGSGAALLMLVEVLIDQDRHQEAVAAGERAVQADPEEEQAHRMLSIALAGVSRYNDAVASAREAVRLAPYLWQTHYTLGMALRLGRRPRTRDALACANEAVRLAPHASHTHNLAGLCLDDLRLGDEAIKAYREALRMDPENATAMNNLAASQLEGGRLADASRMLTSGLSTAPQESMLHRNYDFLLLRLVWRLYIALIALGLILGILAGNQAPYAVRVATVAALLAVYVAAAQRVTRHLPRGTHLWARGLFRRIGWLQRLVVAGFLLLSVTVLVMGLAPSDVALATGIGTLVVLRAIGIVSWVSWVLRPIVGGVKNLAENRRGRRRG